MQKQRVFYRFLSYLPIRFTISSKLQTWSEIADKWRNMSLWITIAALPAIGFWLLSWSEHYRKNGIAGFLVCFLPLFIGSFFLFPKLTCPGCRHAADHNVEYFCPECGSQTLDRSYSIFCICRCKSCGKKLKSGKGGRRYKIRFCTVCGAHLDDKGI